MATFSQGILGGFSGKVGNIVGSSWKGTNVIKIKPSSVSNPNTLPQQNQRMRFALVGRFLQVHRNLVNIGFSDFKAGMSPTNAAMAYNLQNAITGVFPDLSIDYKKVQLSHGSLPVLAGATATVPDDLTIALAWTDNTGNMKAQATDQLAVGFFHPESGETAYFINCAARSEATVSLTLPAEWAGRSLEVLVFLTSATYLAGNSKRQSVSNTQWVATVTLE